MENDVEIRIVAAQPADANDLIALLNKLETESDFFELNVDLHKIDAEELQQQIYQIQVSGSNLILLAVAGEKLIGITTVTEVKPGVGELGIAVLADYQRMGLGTLLLDSIIEWQQQDSKLDNLLLEVLTANKPAQKLYEKMGFKTISETKNSIKMSLN
ncbi:GNAT family N-acetyltransferase [Fructilactobacillus vespulae]|uniref:GNAT family N-acetyltransferase n=1 Tax=Fructilactobacillus vespulae TaxID=1249630 RepID=UPI0039B3F55F